MKNSELTLSRRSVNMSWKEDIYSLPEICNWFRNENPDKKKEAELKKFFELVKIPRPSINPAFIRQNCPVDHLVNNEIKKLVKNQVTGKFQISDIKREKFSAWYIQGCILNAAAKIQAKAGTKAGGTNKKTDLEKTEENLKNNKKRNENTAGTKAAEIKAAAAAKAAAAKKEREAAAAAKAAAAAEKRKISAAKAAEAAAAKAAEAAAAKAAAK